MGQVKALPLVDMELRAPHTVGFGVPFGEIWPNWFTWSQMLLSTTWAVPTTPYTYYHLRVTA